MKKSFFAEVAVLLLMCFTASAGVIGSRFLADRWNEETSVTISLAALKRFDTQREAAVYAAARLEKCSHYYECSTTIAKDPAGKFVVGGARTDYQSDSVHTPDIVPIGWTLAADIHSHPCVPEHVGNMFSPADIISSITSRTPMYMVDLCTGKVHEFLNGITRPDEVLVNEDTWTTEGAIIGQVEAFPTDPIANVGI